MSLHQVALVWRPGCAQLRVFSQNIHPPRETLLLHQVARAAWRAAEGACERLTRLFGEMAGKFGKQLDKTADGEIYTIAAMRKGREGVE